MGQKYSCTYLYFVVRNVVIFNRLYIKGVVFFFFSESFLNNCDSRSNPHVHKTRFPKFPCERHCSKWSI